MSVLKASTAADVVLVPTGTGLFARLAGRRREPRAQAAARPPTGPGERALVEGRDDADRMLVGTAHALYRQPAADGPQQWDRWGWEMVGRVDWAAARRLLTLCPPLAPDSAATVLRLRPRRSARLVAFAAERVSAGMLLDTHAALADGRLARVVGRCRPGAAEPLWFVSLTGRADDGTTDPRTDAMVTEAIAVVRRRHGI